MTLAFASRGALLCAALVASFACTKRLPVDGDVLSDGPSSTRSDDAEADEPFVLALHAQPWRAQMGQWLHIPLRIESGVPAMWTVLDAPAGVSVVNDGASEAALEGIPERDGPYTLFVRAESARGDTAEATLELFVEPEVWIDQAALPVAVVGVPYQFALAHLGIEEGTWELQGVLPAGIAFHDGTFEGTATHSGNAHLSVSVHGFVGGRATWSGALHAVSPLAVTEAPAPIRVRAGDSAATRIEVSGGTGNLQLSLDNDPLLSSWLRVAQYGSIVELSGTPPEALQAVAHVRLRDETATHVVDVPVEVLPALVIDRADLRTATYGTPYIARIAVEGVVDALQVRVLEAFPEGFAVAVDGSAVVVQGTPRVVGQGVVAFDVEDAGEVRTARFSLDVQGAPPVVTSTLAPAREGAPYEAVLTATQALDAPLTWTVTGLPDGFVVDREGSAQGAARIVGTTSTPGRFSVHVTAADAGGAADAYLELIVDESPVFELAALRLPLAHVGTPFTAWLHTVDAVAPVHLEVAHGALPRGLSLVDDGDRGAHLEGVPTTAGNATFTLRATDAAGAVSERAFFVVVSDGPARAALVVEQPEGLELLVRDVDDVSAPPRIVATGISRLASVEGMSFSPTSDHFVFTVRISGAQFASTELFLADLREDPVVVTKLASVALSDEALRGSFSPTGALVHVSAQSADRVRRHEVFDVDAHTVRVVDVAAPHARAQWSPDGGSLALTNDSGVHVWRAGSSAVEAFPFAAVSLLTWVGDSEALVVLDATHVQALDLASGTFRRLAPRGDRSVLSPDGTSLLTSVQSPIDAQGGRSRHVVQLVDVSRAHRARAVQLVGEDVLLDSARFSPDGAHLAIESTTFERSVLLFDVADAAKAPRTLLRRASGITWSLDGQHVFLRDGGLLVRRAIDGATNDALLFTAASDRAPFVQTPAALVVVDRGVWTVDTHAASPRPVRLDDAELAVHRGPRPDSVLLMRNEAPFDVRIVDVRNGVAQAPRTLSEGVAVRSLVFSK